MGEGRDLACGGKIVRALSVGEIDNLVGALRTLVGARLQEAVVGPSGAGLGLFADGNLLWVWFDAHTWSPMLLPLTEVPESNLKPLKPLLLFLRAHFVGHRLLGAERDVTLGRAIQLTFGSEESPRIVEARLWPHGGNLIVHAENKSVALRKTDPRPAELKVIAGEPSPRSLEQILEEWIQLRFARKDVGKKSPEKTKSSPAQIQDKEVRRLEKAIAKVKAEIENKSGSPWRATGEWLVQEQNLAVPDAFRSFVDQRRSLAWNIENCFGRAKETERKLVQTKARLKKLETELAQAQAGPRITTVEPSPAAVRRPVNDQGIKFRTIQLPGGLVARIGRSAQDNLQLLRGARPWDFWAHLRDFPGAHAIIGRERQQSIGDEVLRAVGGALIEQTFGAKSKQHEGERFELIVAECRFVRPIRGDRHGRVTYTHDRTVGFRWP